MKRKIYLSGGMKSKWQVDAKTLLGTPFIYFDPSLQNLPVPDQYVLWDLAAVRECDIVLAYLEEDNPSGIGLALEVGYARAYSKYVILVDEKPDEHYFDIVREASSAVCNSLEEAAHLIQAIEALYVVADYANDGV